MIIAWFLHAIFSTLIAYGLAHLFGGLSPGISAFSLIVGGYLGWKQSVSFRKLNPDWRFAGFSAGEPGAMEIILSVFVLYAAYRHFTWMLFPMDNAWVTLSQNNFGDLPLHINFIRALANGIPFPPHNPIFASDYLRYPYGIELYNAMLEQIGFRLQAHLLFVGGLATLASLILLRSFAGWVGIGSFFLSGGLAGWEVVSGSALKDYQGSVDWKNLFLSVFITQRGMLLTLPMGLFLLISVRRHLSGVARLTRKQMTVLGIVWGFLPLFHLHAFVVVSLMLGAIAIEYGGFKGLLQFLKSRMTLIAYLPSIYFILFSTHFLKSTSLVRFTPGWTMKDAPAFHWLLENFGPWLFVPLVIALILLSPRGKFTNEEKKRLWIEFATYSILFLLFFNVMLAPWDWDNIKLLIWPYLGFARLIWLLFDRRLGEALGLFERPLLAVILFFSGTVAVTWTLLAPVGRAVPIYQIGDLANAEGALATVPKTAVFAAATAHQHELTYFGRLRVAGYQGHLWSHGIDSRVVNEKLDRIMRGDPDSISLAKELGVTHIFWGPEERLQYGDHQLPWMQVLPNVSRVPGYEIYAIK